MTVREGLATTTVIVAKGGGGRSGGIRSSSSSSRSSSSKSSSSKSSSSSSSKATPAPPPKPKPGVSKAAPGTAIKTADGKTVVSSTKKPVSSRYTSSKGVVGDNGYTPRFNNYSAPAGSVVYYPQHSALDYLPWIYLFSQDSPQNDQAVIVQPDGKEVQAAPVSEGVDGMVIFNWIVLIIIIAAICAGIVYLVNKLTSRPIVPKAQFRA